MRDRVLVLRIIGLVAAIVVLLLLLTYPSGKDRPDVVLLSQALYFGIAAMGLNLLTGYNGQVSIGHGAFFGIGAFTSAVLVTEHDWEFLPTMPVAALFAAVVGLVVGFPALRLKGLYLALVTLGLAVLFPDFVKKFVDTGGSNLVSVRRRLISAPSWWPEGASEQHEYAFYLCLFIGLILLVASYLMVRSRFGRALIAVRDHEAAASTVGINVSRAKLGAFTVSAMYAGIAGSLSVVVLGTAEANKATTFSQSILFLVAVVIGGTATVVGPIIGGFLVVFIQDLVGNFVEHPKISLFGWDILPGFMSDFFVGKEVLSPAIFGITLILMMYVMPDGLVGGFKRLYNRLWNMGPARERRAATPATN